MILGRMSLDPVCGERVAEEHAVTFEYKRKTYYFCSRHCRSRFERQAERNHQAELARLGALFAEKKVRWGLA